MIEVLAHAIRSVDSSFTMGGTDEELIQRMETSVGSVKRILDTKDYVYESNGHKAFYQVHLTEDGRPPLNSPFAQTVSLLDNVQLIVGLQFLASYLDSIDSQLDVTLQPRATQLRQTLTSEDGLLNQFDLGMWLRENRMYLGQPNDPDAGSHLDRIISESRLSPMVAYARGEISQDQMNAVLDQMVGGSKPQRGESATIQKLPYFGTALEVFAQTPFLSSELETLLGTESILPVSQAWNRFADKNNLPAAGGTGIATGIAAITVQAEKPNAGDGGNGDGRPWRYNLASRKSATRGPIPNRRDKWTRVPTDI